MTDSAHFETPGCAHKIKTLAHFFDRHNFKNTNRDIFHTPKHHYTRFHTFRRRFAISFYLERTRRTLKHETAAPNGNGTQQAPTAPQGLVKSVTTTQ